MSVLGVVVARKGSKRVPGKNLRLLGFAVDKPEPLVCWTFKVAKQAESLDRVVVSTDDKKVKRLAEQYKIEVPFFPRPKELSEDVDSVWVLKHVLDFLQKKEKYRPSHVVLLQPTSPFRYPEDINRCVEIAKKTDCDTVVSVVPVSQHPYWTFKGQTWYGQLRLKPYEDVDLAGENLISQNLPKLWYPAGMVYVIKREVVMNGRIFGREIRGYEVQPPERGLDIETEQDLLIAEAMLEERAKKRFKKTWGQIFTEYALKEGL